MHIQVLRKEIYGKTVFYPVCEKAILFAAIAGTKTLTHDAIRQIKAIGFNVTTVHPEDIA